MKERYRELYSSRQINQRIGQLASEITANYNGDEAAYGENPLFIALLRGAAPFASKLMFEIDRQAPDFHPEMDYMMTTREAERFSPHAETEIIMDLAPDTEVKNRNVIIVDNVLDMGETAVSVRNHVLEMGARYVELAALVEKDIERSAQIEADYLGFTAPNQWLVGMGMDDSAIAKESYRWSNGIWVVDQGVDLPQHALISR